MNTKKLVTLLVLLIIVVGIVVLTENIDKLSPSSDGGALLPGLSEDNISAFLVAGDNDTVKIRRKGDIWVIAAEAQTDETGGLAGVSDTAAGATGKPQRTREYPADSASVATALEKLGDLTKDDLVSNNPEKQEVYEVDSANGTLVKVWDRNGKPLGSFRIGKSAQDWSSNYVRLVGSDEVYSVGGSIKHSFFTDKERWRDKTILKFDKARATAITLAKGGRAIELEKKQDSTGAAAWMIVSPEKHEADTNKVNQVLRALSNLRTTGWEESEALDDDTLGFSSPELIASVTLDNGDTKEVIVGAQKSEGGKFWVRSPGKDPTFLVADHTISDIDVGMDDLKAPPPVEEKEESEEAGGA